MLFPFHHLLKSRAGWSVAIPDNWELCSFLVTPNEIGHLWSVKMGCSSCLLREGWCCLGNSHWKFGMEKREEITTNLPGIRREFFPCLQIQWLADLSLNILAWAVWKTNTVCFVSLFFFVCFSSVCYCLKYQTATPLPPAGVNDV